MTEDCYPRKRWAYSLEAQVPGKLGLNRTAEYGSSDTIRPDLDGGDAVDENNGNHVNISLFLRPEAFPGLQVSGSFYHDRISDFLEGPTSGSDRRS